MPCFELTDAERTRLMAMDATFGPMILQQHQPGEAMNTTTKKTHIYVVEVSRSDTPLIKVLVRAESKAQARSAIANTMIRVERASQDDLLGASPSQVIDGTNAQPPEQAALPVDAAAEPFGKEFIASIEAGTAAEQMEDGNDGE